MVSDPVQTLGHLHDTATILGRCIQGLLDGGGVIRLAVCLGSVIQHVDLGHRNAGSQGKQNEAEFYAIHPNPLSGGQSS